MEEGSRVAENYPREAGLQPAKGCFINNRWELSASGRSLPVVAPAEGVVFAEIAAGNASDIDRAVTAARAALKPAPGDG